MKETYINLWDIKFCKVDEDGEYITDDNGDVVEYELFPDIRYKPLEHICEGIDEEMLRPIEKGEII